MKFNVQKDNYMPELIKNKSDDPFFKNEDCEDVPNNIYSNDSGSLFDKDLDKSDHIQDELISDKLSSMPPPSNLALTVTKAQTKQLKSVIQEDDDEDEDSEEEKKVSSLLSNIFRLLSSKSPLEAKAFLQNQKSLQKVLW